MADQKQLDLLRAGVDGWNEWRSANPKVRPDLTGAILTSANLTSANLTGANLSFANLSSANLTGANLSFANLTGADLTNAILSGAILTRALLFDANIRMADLSGANLTNAILCGAKLSNAKLYEAKLYEANLDGAKLLSAKLGKADLTRAILRGANLSTANLTGANLFKADLTGANLNGANLNGANLSSAELGYTVFADVDLSQVKGLDAVIHHAPSSIGIDTIYRSEEKIPEVFLRGCGVPEDFITHMWSRAMKPFEFYSCFISYSHTDKFFAKRLHDALQGQGIRCWLDEHQLLPGDDPFEMIDRGIRLWDKVLLCASKASLTSWWVDKEVKTAFDKEQDLTKQRKRQVMALIPLNLDGHLFKKSRKATTATATVIKSRIAADFTGWENDNDKFESEFARLLKALRADDGGREKPPTQRL